MKKTLILILAIGFFAFTPWNRTYRIVAGGTSKSDTVKTSTGGFLLTVKGKAGMYVTIGTPPCSSTFTTDTNLYRNFPVLSGQTVYLGIPSKTCVAAISIDSATTDTLYITQGK